MAEVSLATPKGLQSFILAMPELEVSVEDVLHRYWDDWDELVKREKQLQTSLEDNKRYRASLPIRQRRVFSINEIQPLRKDLLGLKTLRKAWVARVKLAFNQLFLTGRVKMKLYPRPEFGEDYNTPRTFTEYKTWRIMRCEDDIKGVRELVKNGEGGVFMECWLGNLYDYLESYKGTEVLERRKLDPSLQRVMESKGAWVCLGGLFDSTWPDVIVKLDNSDCILQGRLF